MTIICRTVNELRDALHKQGFFLVTDLPRPLRVEVRRGMLVARFA